MYLCMCTIHGDLLSWTDIKPIILEVVKTEALLDITLYSGTGSY